MHIFTYLFLLLFVLFPFGQLTRISPHPSVHIYMHDVVVAGMVLTWGVYRYFHKQHTHPPAAIHILLFIAWSTITLALNAPSFHMNELLISSLYLLRWITYAGLYFVIYDIVKSGSVSNQFVFNGLTGTGIAIAVFGMFQYVLYPNLRNLLYAGWDPHEYRVFGTFLDSAFIGILLVVTILLLTDIIIDITQRSFRNMPFLLYSTATLFVFVVLLFTYSRSSYIALIAGLWIQSYVKKSYMISLLLTILMIISLPFLPKPSQTSEAVNLTRTSTIDARMTNYEQTKHLISQNWLYGTGFNTLRYVHREAGIVPAYEWESNHAASGTDNSFLFVWVTTGIIGLFLYIHMGWHMVNGVHESYKPVVYSSLAAVIVHSMFNNTLFYPWVMIWIWLLLGVSHHPRNFSLISRFIPADYFYRIISFFQRRGI